MILRNPTSDSDVCGLISSVDEFLPQFGRSSSLFSFFMDWILYSKRFKISAKRRGFSDNEIAFFLDYAKSLSEKNLPIIFNADHFSRLVGYSTRFIYGLSNDRIPSYVSFRVKKHNGGRRTIDAPILELKRIQSWILSNILSRVEGSVFSKAYSLGSSIKENAKFHLHQPVLIKMDFKDFFTSIKQPYVIRLFQSLGYSKELAGLLGRLCCHHGYLPQGSPTSPHISNLFCRKLDKRIGNYIRKMGFRYTRYSDDITISGNILDKQIGAIIEFCKKCAFENNLEINVQKTQVIRPHGRQLVTGVVVNKKLSAGTRKKKEIRKQIYYIRKYGLESHISHEAIEKQNYIYHLAGLVNWVLYIEKNNKEFCEYKKYISEIIVSSNF